MGSMLRKRFAFNLPELMLSALIFSSVAYALMSVWITHSVATERAQQMRTAAHIAEVHLAEQETLGFKSVSRSGVTTVNRYLDGVATPYTYNWQVDVYDTTVNRPNIKNVDCRVTWTLNNVEHKVLLETSVYWAG